MSTFFMISENMFMSFFYYSFLLHQITNDLSLSLTNTFQAREAENFLKNSSYFHKKSFEEDRSTAVVC